VTLVDTDGHGLDGMCADGVLFQDQEFKVEILIFGTGYHSPALGNVASRSCLTVKGREGKTIDEVWANGISTLHGVACRNFPNFFFNGPPQTAAGPNYSFFLDQISQHVAYIITQSIKNAGCREVLLEPTEEAMEAWSVEISKRAVALAGVKNCTPSYYNREGEADRERSSTEQMKAARSAPWGQGIESYLEVLGDWRSKGDLQGFEVTLI